MQAITLYSHVGTDGVLQLKLPDSFINTDCKIILQPIEQGSFLALYGSWEGEFERDQPTEYEQREDWC